MANNTTLDPGTGGDTIRDLDRAGVKTQIVALDLNPAGSETLMSGTMPVDSELPAAAALSDAAANPTTPTVGAGVLVWNGTTWDRAKGDTTNGMFVNVKTSVLPTGAATSAKQPALGTAGSSSTDVLSVQGIASGTALPVSGTVTANLGTANVTNAGTFAVQADTELPAAAALADAAANPTTPMVGSAGLLFNGTTWDRVRGDTTNGLFVNVKTSVLPTGASTSAKQPALGTAGAASADVLSVQGIASMTPMKTDGSAFTQPVSAAVGSPVFVTVTPSTSGGWTPKVFSAAAAAAKTLINGAACTFGGHLTIYNPNVSVAYIQVFDAATTGAVTVGTTPATALIIIPATSAANVEITNGVHMANGIVIAATTTAAGSTGVTTAIDGTILYK